MFTSDTDTESIAHLIEATLKSEPDLFTAIRLTCTRLIGTFAIAIIDQHQPNKIIVARENSPLLLGVSDNNNYSTYRDWETDRKSTRLNSSHEIPSRMPSSA